MLISDIRRLVDLDYYEIVVYIRCKGSDLLYKTTCVRIKDSEQFEHFKDIFGDVEVEELEGDDMCIICVTTFRNVTPETIIKKREDYYCYL